MMLDLNRDAMFLGLVGSRAHGTASDQSDIDIRGVCIAPLSLRLSLTQPRFEQVEPTLTGTLWNEVRGRLESHANVRTVSARAIEVLVFDIAKFLRLCIANNPQALEVLFLEPTEWLFATEAWQRVYAERRRFLTSKLRATYFGYGQSQLRQIVNRRTWLHSPPTKAPVREEFGLAPAVVLNADDRNRIESALAERLRKELEAERRYRGALKDWHSYLDWKANRSPARAELERRHGYDTKHAAHLLRLLETGVELLRDGALNVCRKDAAELVAVRDGAFTFEQLTQRVRQLQAQMQAAAATCSLPSDIDHRFVDELMLSLVRGHR